MSYHTKLPDEQGWYWCRSRHDCWSVAFVSTRDEVVAFFDEDEPFHNPATFNFDAPNVAGVVEWYGPFHCPGGDFGEHSVVPCAELREKARMEGKAIGIQYVDFRACKDELHGSSFTITGLYDREAAMKLIRMHE